MKGWALWFEICSKCSDPVLPIMMELYDIIIQVMRRWSHGVPLIESIYILREYKAVGHAYLRSVLTRGSWAPIVLHFARCLLFLYSDLVMVITLRSLIRLYY